MPPWGMDSRVLNSAMSTALPLASWPVHARVTSWSPPQHVLGAAHRLHCSAFAIAWAQALQAAGWQVPGQQVVLCCPRMVFCAAKQRVPTNVFSLRGMARCFSSCI